MKRGFFLETVQLTKREVIERRDRINIEFTGSPRFDNYFISKIKHEEIEVILNFTSSGKTKKITNDHILKVITGKLMEIE